MRQPFAIFPQPFSNQLKRDSWPIFTFAYFYICLFAFLPTIILDLVYLHMFAIIECLNHQLPYIHSDPSPTA